jgi:predicted nuclease with TOPRIM domain
MVDMAIIMWSVGMLAGLVSIYVRMETKLKELDVRVKNLEHTDAKMNEKLDKILDDISWIKLALKDKADKN